MSTDNINSTIEYGYRSIRLGIGLLKKKNRTEFEDCAAKSFKVTMISMLIVLAICFFVIIASIIVTFTSNSFNNYSSRRTGTVEGDKVRYVESTMKYVSLEELNINEDDVIQGEKIRLFFDTEDRLMGGESEAKSDIKIYNLLITLGITFVGIIIFIIVVRTTYGKPWRKWLNSLN